MPLEQGEPVGLVAHYFAKIGVAVIELSQSLKVGDSIKVVGGNIDFDQAVVSIEMDKQKVGEAKAGEVIGIKLNQRAKEGCQVYKLRQ